MPECGNCGAFVTQNYTRVFAPRSQEQVRCCPDCPDLIRRRGDVEEARSTRGNGQ